MKCNLYSELMAEKYKNSDKDMSNYYLSLKGTEKDYTICQSSVLDEIAKFGDPKAHSLVGRDNIQSWLDSDYCKNGSHICLLVGNLGPAWK